MSRLDTVNLSAIRPNPHRRMETYPLNRKKLDALKESINHVGFWEGVIVRPAGNGFELAFGHHRIEAAREQLGDNAAVPVIVRTLDDGQMLQFMARENGEDFNTEFLVQLEAWDAAVVHLAGGRPQNLQLTEIARFLGWTEIHKDRDLPAANRTAKACNAAFTLIHDGHLSRKDLEGLSVFDANEVCAGVQHHLDSIRRKHETQKRIAKGSGTPVPTDRQRKRVEKEYVSAAKSVADDLRSGAVTTKKARGEIWNRADTRVREKGLPDFAQAVNALQKQAREWCGDKFAEKVKEICAAAHLITDDDDRAKLGYLATELEQAGERCERNRDRLEDAKNRPVQSANVTPLKLLGEK